MAIHLNPAFKYRTDYLPSQPLHFMRSDGHIQTKKIQRIRRLKFRHILLILLLTGGFFLALQQSYLFLISWDKLTVREFIIDCRKPEVKEEVQRFFQGKNLGNILLLDIGQLQQALLSNPWVKDVQVRRIFPSSLKIRVHERTPAAVLKKKDLILIDKDSRELRKAALEETDTLPVFIDAQNFGKDLEGKLQLAWACLDSLSSLDTGPIEALDLSDFDNVKIKFRESPTWFIFGGDHFVEKFQSYQTYRDSLEKYGDLDYVDLRYFDRFIVRPTKTQSAESVQAPEKEAN